MFQSLKRFRLIGYVYADLSLDIAIDSICYVKQLFFLSGHTFLSSHTGVGQLFRNSQLKIWITSDFEVLLRSHSMFIQHTRTMQHANCKHMIEKCEGKDETLRAGAFRSLKPFKSYTVRENNLANPELL